jgi:hypothetical protein
MKPDVEVLLDALERSCAIWGDVRNTSDEAWRIHRILRSMLLSFRPAASSQLQGLEMLPIAYAADRPIQFITGTIEIETSQFGKLDEMDIEIGFVSVRYLYFKSLVLILKQATWDSIIEGASFEE